MRKFIVQQEQVNQLEAVGLDDAVETLFAEADLTQQQLAVDAIPADTPHFSEFKTNEWLDDIYTNYWESGVYQWLGDEEKDECSAYFGALGGELSSERRGFASDLYWQRSDGSDVAPRLRAAPQDLAVLIGTAATELFEEDSRLFEQNWQRFGSKLDLIQVASAYVLQKAALAPYPRGWLYGNSFHESLLPEANDVHTSIAVGSVSLNDTHVVLQQNAWFGNGSLTPLMGKKVPFTPVSAEGQIDVANYGAIPKLISNCMAFLDYANVSDEVQARMFSAALQRVYYQTDSTSLPLHGELIGLDIEEISDEARQNLYWRRGNSPALQKLITKPDKFILPNHAILMSQPPYRHDGKEMGLIYFDECASIPYMNFVQGRRYDTYDIEPEERIALEVSEIGALLESLLYINQTQSMNYAPKIALMMIRERYGSLL